MFSVPLEEGLKLLFDNLTKITKSFTMERKEFELVIFETITRLECIKKLKNREYEITLNEKKYHEDGMLKGCGEFYLILEDAFHSIRIEILVNEKANIFNISFDGFKWLVPYDVSLLNTICEVLL